MQSPWQASSDAAATEHTGEPQLAGYVHTHAVNYDGNATEHANAGSSSGEWPIVAGSSTDAGRAALQLESDADFRARVDRALAASRAQGEAAQPTGTSTQGIPAPADTGASQSSTSRPLTVLDVDNRTARTSGPDWRPAALCEEGGCLQTRLHGSLYCETHDAARATAYVLRQRLTSGQAPPSGAEPPRCKEKGCQLTRCGFSVFCVQHEVQYRERSTHFRGNFRILQVPLTDLPNGPMGVRAILEFPAGTGPALPQGVQPHHRHILAPIRSGPGAQEAADNDGRSLQAAASIGTPMELTATFETGEESGPFPDPVTGGEQPPEALIESRRRAAVADARAAAAANAAAVAHAAAAAAVAEARLHPSPAGLGVSPPSATAAAGPQTSPHGTEALSVEAAGSGGNATEHANAGSSSGEWPIVATEHDDGPDILFTIDDASERRRSFRGQPGRLHSEARQRLNEVTEIAAQDDADEVYCIGDTFCWKDYIAWHDDCNEIIGTGIIAAHLEKYAAQQIIIEQTMPELITCSTDPTTRIAECIPAPNAKTMHN